MTEQGKLGKFGNLINKEKKEIITHAEIQKTEVQKKGGRPQKSSEQKMNQVVSLNVSIEEKETLEKEAAAIGLNVVSLARMSLTNVSINFEPVAISTNTTVTNVVKQYAIPVTQQVKTTLETKANTLMISISDLIKMALKSKGFYNI